MNKKLLIAFSMLIGLGVSKLTAAEPIFEVTAAESSYYITHSSVSISSVPATSDGVLSDPGYSKVTFQLLPTQAQMQAGTSVFFSLNGSTVNILRDGYMVAFSSPSVASTAHRPIYEVTFETNQRIRTGVAPGSTNVEGRYMRKRK